MGGSSQALARVTSLPAIFFTSRLPSLAIAPVFRKPHLLSGNETAGQGSSITTSQGLFPNSHSICWQSLHQNNKSMSSSSVASRLPSLVRQP